MQNITSVCFIGHRKIKDTPELRNRLRTLVTELIGKGAENFLFGDHSAFNDLCYETVTELKKEYPAIRRIHFRRDHEDANDYTMQFLISGYEESICPEGVGKAGRSGYIERNQEMIRESDICIFYYDAAYLPPVKKSACDALIEKRPKSGTQRAYMYAVQKGKVIYNLFRSFSEEQERE